MKTYRLKNKVFSIFIALIMTVSLLPTASAADIELTATTAVTSGNTYLISSAEQLGYLADIVNGTGAWDGSPNPCTDITFVLTDDIALGYWQDTNGNDIVDSDEIYDSETDGTLCTSTNWTPIGCNGPNPFRGTFNGGNFSVSGLYANDTETIYYGLFGNTYGTITDLSLTDSYMLNIGTHCFGGIAAYNSSGTIENCTFSGTISSTNANTAYIGGIAAYNDNGTIENCASSGSFSASYSNDKLGGITGMNDGTITACHNEGELAGQSYAGGITGRNTATVEYCYNTGTIVANRAFCGGIAGDQIYGTTQYCYNSGTVRTGGENGGGIIGENERGTISHCFNTADLSLGSISGGIAGYSRRGSISYCYNTGNISGSHQVGGIVGHTAVSGSVSYCYNSGRINGSQNVGGIAGFNAVTVSNCYNSNWVSNGVEAAAVVGNNYGTIISCYYDKQMCTLPRGANDNNSSGPASDIQALLTDEMTDSMLEIDDGGGWSEAIWTFEDNLYPQLNCFADTDESYVSVSPVYLAYDSTADYETVSLAETHFNANVENDVSWSSSDSNIVLISDSDSSAAECDCSILLLDGETDTVTLTATLNGTTRTVTLNVTGRLPYLTSLTPSSGSLNESFESSALDYTMSVANDITQITLTPVANDSDTTIEYSPDNISWTTVASGSATSDIGLDIGENIVYMRVTNINGYTQTYTVTITRAADAPVITSGPEDISESVGDDETLTIAATGSGDLTYQWYQSDDDTADSGDTPLPGATDAAYTPDSSTAGTYYYYCVVTNTCGNEYACTASDVATVTVSSISNPPVSYDVIYNGNGSTNGEVPASASYASGRTVTIKDNVGQLQSNGSSFAGWNTKPDGSGTDYAPGDTFTITSNVTLYAQWATAADTLDSCLNTEDHMAYVRGYDDGTVRPEGSITRAESATMIYRLLTAEHRDEIFTAVSDFSDVTGDLWYNKAVSSMVNGGYIDGYDDGTFMGNQAITRTEFITTLVRFIGVDETAAVDFTDVSEDYWAYGYIATAVTAGWIEGYEDGTFMPDGSITRAEAITIINRVLERGIDEDSELPDGITPWPDVDTEDWYYYEIIEASNAHEYTGTRPDEDWTSLGIDYSYDMETYENP